MPRSLWAEAEGGQVFNGAPVDLADGFIHFSSARQIEETAARHFAGQRDLLVVAVDTSRLRATLRWEASRGGALFPHLHGVLALADVAWVRPLPDERDGRRSFADILA